MLANASPNVAARIDAGHAGLDPRASGDYHRGVQRYVCIHGHFYQPPRENAWLDRIERQDSAHPFHDWNERIESECYGPNARARVLDAEDRVVAMVNNYARISYNIGPTLLSWMEAHAPRTYASVIQADRDSAARFGGHGSAMAQVWGHVILPLSDARDRRTQVHWGVRDFVRRYGRQPDGMWLPETAACTASLRELADAGIRFTVLSPRQARSVLPPGASEAIPVHEGTLDTRRAYEVDVGDGKSIAVFFYDGATSQAIAFERLLVSGDTFASRLLRGFGDADGPALVHVATDGETYGHHHRFGEMALAYALSRIEKSGLAQLTNYAQYLALFPPTHKAEIHERTSWSCAHGVGRWSADCGCRMAADSNQAWRGPLRDALDRLRDRIDAIFERVAAPYLSDPWAARDDYIDVVLDRSALGPYLEKHAKRPLDARERRTVLESLEMQRHRMLMYTSCGWFFDDVAGLETTQILQYAVRATEHAEALGGEPLLPSLLGDLEAARAAQPGAESARSVVERRVLRTRIDFERAAASHAIVSLFGRAGRIVAPAFEVTERAKISTRRDELRFAAGKLTVRSTLTTEQRDYVFAITHDGGPAVAGGLREGDVDEAAWDAITSAFEEHSIEQVRALVARTLPTPIGSLRVLPFDERLRVVDRIIADDVRHAEEAYRRLFEENAPLLHELAAMGVRPPRALSAATRIVLEGELLRAVDADPADTELMRAKLDEIHRDRIRIDDAALVLAMHRAIERTCAQLERDVCDDAAIEKLADLVTLAQQVSSHFDLSRPQALAWEALFDEEAASCRAVGAAGRREAWRRLAEALRIRLD